MGKKQGLPVRLQPEDEAKLPNLKSSPYKVTSPFSYDYNCVAFAAGDQTRKWDPGMPPFIPGYYWPSGASRGPSIEDLVSAFTAIKYESCAGQDHEPEYEKVALFADQNGNWTHAARQRADGLWESKLGNSFDIRHKTAHSVSGSEYGTVWCYMRRKK